MRLSILAAVAALVFAAHVPAEAGTITSRIDRIDTAKRVVYLTDRTAMIVGPDVDLTKLKPADRVLITAELDEDGYKAVTGITPLK